MCHVNRSPGRQAYTLIELLVVIAIITAIAVMGYVALPRVQDNYKMARSADRLAQWLLTAKQRARRDGQPTGLRLYPDASNFVRKLAYIQQPDPLVGGYINSSGARVGGFIRYATSGATGSTVHFGNVDFTGAGTSAGQADVSPVQAGDYLELFGGGTPHIITGVALDNFMGSGPNDYILTLSNTTVAFGTLNTTNPAATYSTMSYRILRQPRLLLGEDALSLPDDVAVDLTATGTAVPQRQGFFEVLFTPSGQVIMPSGPIGKVLMLVNDVSSSAGSTQAAPMVVAVQTKSGFIATHPSGPSTDPFAYTRDGRSSGL